MIRLRNSLRSFARDDRGVLLAEALILLPMLIWAFIALVVYWDVFRTINSSQKASYSIADLLSRQGVVTADFVNGLDEVLVFLTPGVTSSSMRVTSFEFDEGDDDEPGFDGDDEYCVLFSRSPNNEAPELSANDLEDVRAKIPNMNDGESFVLVETWVEYAPDFDIGVLNWAPGLSDQTFSQFIVTRPRNWRRVTMDGVAHPCPN